MSSSHRRENPSRSAAESAARHRNYRFKSYLEANTQERARFDSMQGHVPDKIAEVIASFREEKLTVHPHRPQAAGVLSDVAQESDRPRVRSRTRAVAVAVAPAVRPRPGWHWYLIVLGLALALMIWLDARSGSDQPALSLPVPTSGSTGELSTQPGYDTSAHSDAAAMSHRPIARPPVAAKPAESAVQPALTAPKSVATPQRKKPASSGARQSKGEALHYSEDLTGLLQSQ